MEYTENIIYFSYILIFPQTQGERFWSLEFENIFSVYSNIPLQIQSGRFWNFEFKNRNQI
jgi:hypothetical protein